MWARVAYPNRELWRLYASTNREVKLWHQGCAEARKGCKREVWRRLGSVSVAAKCDAFKLRCKKGLLGAEREDA